MRPSLNSCLWLLILVLAAGAPTASAQRLAHETPAELDGVGVQEHLGDQINLELQFTAEDGYQKPLSTYFQSGRPVILNLVYYTCPMLCNLVLNAQTEAIRNIPWTPGKEYEIVTISIDPTENYGIARNKKAAYLTSFEREAPGWHFLTDFNGSAARLAKQVGFGYKLDERTGQYAHSAVIFILTPDGRISRYLYGIKYKPLDIRLALAEAAEGKLGMSVEKFLLYCFHYDPDARSYTLFARNIMRGGGALLLLVMGIVLFRFWRRERQLARATRLMVNAQ
mgnify:CR=1 FL=1